jgi:hypothetical protein
MDPMIAALLECGAYDHPVGPIALIETHISWVLLTGAYAYKLYNSYHGYIICSNKNSRNLPIGRIIRTIHGRLILLSTRRSKKSHCNTEIMEKYLTRNKY